MFNTLRRFTAACVQADWSTAFAVLWLTALSPLERPSDLLSSLSTRSTVGMSSPRMEEWKNERMTEWPNLSNERDPLISLLSTVMYLHPHLEEQWQQTSWKHK